jgi:hypothetical protein
MPQGPEKLAESCRRAAEVREIAKGLYDRDEHDAVLRLADEYEKLAAEKWGDQAPAVEPWATTLGRAR